MQSSVVQVPPSVTNWFQSQKLKLPIAHLKHDFYNGWAFGHLLRKVYGNEKFEVRTLENNTSIACAKHNWQRILELHIKNKFPFELNQSLIDKILLKDETAILKLLISIYEAATGLQVPKIIYPTIPRSTERLKSPLSTLPKMLHSIDTSKLQSSALGNLPVIKLEYPPNMPLFTRNSYDNTRKLIDHLSQVCKKSITTFPDITDYIEMLDPRADFCYPFPQLLLRLPQEYCVKVCQELVNNLDINLITECILEDYLLFYDFSLIMLQSVIALNQVSLNARKLFDIITDYLCIIIKHIRDKNPDSIYIIYQNVIMSRLIKEIPLINFSLTHFFKLCLTCTNNLTPTSFQKLLSASITNLKNTCPLYSENRIRFEVLIAFTIFSSQEKKYNEEIGRSCIKYCLHAVLLPDSDKFVAIDLFIRCFSLVPKLLLECEFPFLRLIGFIVNDQKISPNHIDENEEVVKPLFIESNGFEFEFYFSNLKYLNYEQILFLVLAFKKIESFQNIKSVNINKVAMGIEQKLVESGDDLPPSHFFVGIISFLGRQQTEIVQLSHLFCEALGGILPSKESQKQQIDLCNAQLQNSPQIELFLKTTCQYLLNNPQQFNALFSLLHGRQFEDDILYQFAVQSNFDEEKYFNIQLNSGIGNIVSPFIFQKISTTLYKDSNIQDITPLFLFYFVINTDISPEMLQLLVRLLVVSQELTVFAYQHLSEELFTTVLADDQSLSSSACDALLCILLQIPLQAFSDDIRTNVQTLIEYCYSFAARGQFEGINRTEVQNKCMVFLQHIAKEQEFQSILITMIEKMDYEDFGNDQLGKFINEVAGEL